MSNSLPPIALSPAVLGALHSRGAPGGAAKTPVVSDPVREAVAKPAPPRFDATVRRGQYLDILV
jgi:hypothetical protein